MIISQFKGTYGWLSNFSPCFGLYFKGLSVEHYYQAAKCISENDRQDILSTKWVVEAKAKGRKVKCLPDWEEVKMGVMLNLLRDKFSLRYFRDNLLATGDALLIEGNSRGDTFWGVDSRTCAGDNVLGQLLMLVREELH